MYREVLIAEPAQSNIWGFKMRWLVVEDARDRSGDGIAWIEMLFAVETDIRGCM